MKIYIATGGGLLREIGRVRCERCGEPVRLRWAGGDLFAECDCWREKKDESK